MICSQVYSHACLSQPRDPCRSLGSAGMGFWCPSAAAQDMTGTPLARSSFLEPVPPSSVALGSKQPALSPVSLLPYLGHAQPCPDPKF